MVFTNAGAQFIAWRLGSSLPNDYISAMGLGSGSGAVAITNSTLISEHTRAVITGSPDFTDARKVSFQADFNATTMSGLILTEFGLFKSGTVATGSVWQREAFGSVAFDGTIELQVTTTLEVIPS